MSMIWRSRRLSAVCWTGMVGSRYHRGRERSTTKCVKTRTLSFRPGNLRSRAKVRNRHACFQLAAIGGATGEPFVHVGEHDTAIHRGRIRLESEIEILGLIYLLHTLEIVAVELRYVHENVVVHSDAVLILMRCLAVIGQLSEASSLESS